MVVQWQYQWELKPTNKCNLLSLLQVVRRLRSVPKLRRRGWRRWFLDLDCLPFQCFQVHINQMLWVRARPNLHLARTFGV